jgi:SAM-dependent MidA family methyltransferase
MTSSRWSGWREAMDRALYGDGGFYVAPGAPATAFRTAAHASALWASAIHRLARRVDQSLRDPADFAVVDVGAGGGELLAGLADLAPARWSLVGVDVAPRPPSLPDRVRWQREAPGSVTGLLLAVELLDVVPLDIVELRAAGPRLVEVDIDGAERLGLPPTADDVAGCRHRQPGRDRPAPRRDVAPAHRIAHPRARGRR